MLYIMSQLSLTTSNCLLDIKLQVQFYKPATCSIFKVWPCWKFQKCSFNAYVISWSNQNTSNLVTFIFMEMRCTQAGEVYSFQDQVTHMDRLWMQMCTTKVSVMYCVCLCNQSNDILFLASIKYPRWKSSSIYVHTKCVQTYCPYYGIRVHFFILSFNTNWPTQHTPENITHQNILKINTQTEIYKWLVYVNERLYLKSASQICLFTKKFY